MMNHWDGWPLALLLALAAPGAHAQAAGQDTLRAEVAAGVWLQAEVEEGGDITVALAPSGTRQRLPGAPDVDGQSRLSAEDVDFDGWPELVARASVGMVNEAVAVYRYDPRQKAMQALAPTPHDDAQCGGLMGLTVDAPNRTLSSSCRSGAVWYVDLYRYDGPRLHLYRALRFIHGSDAFEQVLFVRQTADTGPFAVWSTYDAQGAVVETAIADGLVTPASTGRLSPFSGTVVPARLPLHARPGEGRTSRYLLRDDRVELLDERDGWVKVRYHNPTRGDVLGWVNAMP
ncbi:MULTISPECIES: SH3 domain-containing protein [unclassified Stenotrophomonas]|nr:MULTISPECIES: SH3 domain-containing protein [unclassified Stenotrophomonas]MBD3826114.1 SH3 domain-containing protein [Stenotrophomonas sp.]